MSSNRLYLRQLLSGRDFATEDRVAHQMVNYAYAIGDREAGQCVLVDPAYDANELMAIVGAEGMEVIGVLGTHFHADHIGGSMMGHHLSGVRELLESKSVPIHINKEEAPWVKRTTGLSDAELTLHDAGDVVQVGDVTIELVHTPGHTPGSQCFLVDGCLVSGDTLFLDGCGRTDFPGSDPELMYESLQRLATLPTDTIVLPGHAYSPAPQATMGHVRETNYVFRPKTKEQWLMMFGQA
jgi:hydroxyacylglutathione hydrolase